VDERLSARAEASERGFTVIEVLIGLLVLLIGMAGVLTLQLTSAEATSFSRHATEASVLGEDKMEQLRTVPLPVLTDGTDQVDARGIIDDENGLYTRAWTYDPASDLITVTVSWRERGGTDDDNAYTVTLQTARKQ
jgi:prepilin-type N-terminal cleavage/methylation domain-containing protein